MFGRRSSTYGDDPSNAVASWNDRFSPYWSSGSIRALKAPNCHASPAVAQALSPRPCHTGPSLIPQANPELYELEIEGRRTVSDGAFGNWPSMRNVHGDEDESRVAAAHARMVGGAKGRADHGSLPSSPRSARARAYTSHSLPTHVSFQRVPWDQAIAGVVRSKIQNFFITYVLLGALLLNPGAFGATAEAQSACRATTRQLSTIGPRARLQNIAAIGRIDGDIMEDAATCAAGPELLVATVVNLAGRPLRIAPQLPVGERPFSEASPTRAMTVPRGMVEG